MLFVVAIATIVGAVAIPQLVASRRMIRAAGLSREIASQLRVARQEAMSQRQAMTFQYDDSTKQINIIDHQTASKTILTDVNYPNTAGSFVARSSPLAGGGVSASEVSYGIPSGLPTAALDDTTTLTSLASSKLNVTFFPDGSAANNTSATKFSLFFYNPQSPSNTALAVSILGSAGRVKVWRYSSSANKYNE